MCILYIKVIPPSHHNCVAHPRGNYEQTNANIVSRNTKLRVTLGLAFTFAVIPDAGGGTLGCGKATAVRGCALLVLLCWWGGGANVVFTNTKPQFLHSMPLMTLHTVVL